MFLEIGETLFELLREPSGKALRFRQRKLAEFRACAGHGSACEHRSLYRQGSNLKLTSHHSRIALRHVDDQQVLHGGGTNVALRVAIS